MVDIGPKIDIIGDSCAVDILLYIQKEHNYYWISKSSDDEDIDSRPLSYT